MKALHRGLGERAKHAVDVQARAGHDVECILDDAGVHAHAAAPLQRVTGGTSGGEGAAVHMHPGNGNNWKPILSDNFRLNRLLKRKLYLHCTVV